MAKSSGLKGWGVDDSNIDPEAEIKKRLGRLIKKKKHQHRKISIKQKRIRKAKTKRK